MGRGRRQRRSVLALVMVLAVGVVLAWAPCALALDPGMDISQYGHTSWGIREGFITGRINAIAQTPDGYLWLGTEFGLLRFDGVRSVPFQPPGEHLPSNYVRSLVVARDGTLWIGTSGGLASWKDGKLTQYPELAGQEVGALLQDRGGTVWAGTGYQTIIGRLCAIHGSSVQCYGDGRFGNAVYSLYQDTRDNLWVGAVNGLWRWSPGPPKLYPTPDRVLALTEANNGALLVLMRGGIRQLVGGKLEAYPLPSSGLLERLFRDRDGGLWVAAQYGLLHLHQRRVDLFAKSDGLSDNNILALFEDLEGNIWVATNNGLDRFRNLPVVTLSAKQGFSDIDHTASVLAARDGSVWVATLDRLNRWKQGQITVYRRRGSTRRSERVVKGGSVREIDDSGLADEIAGSLSEDHRGRIWASTIPQVVYFENGRFVPLTSTAPCKFMHSISEDSTGDVWISAHESLCHLRDGSVVEQIPWARLGSQDFAETLLADPARGGLWLGFFKGGVSYFKDGQIRASYGRDDGLGDGRVNSLRLDRSGAVWAATVSGLSRLKDGHVATLTRKNGLPCDSLDWVMEDDADSLWLNMACGLVRIARTELDSWVADSKRTVQATVFDSSDGVRSHSFYGSTTPHVGKSLDGKIWFSTWDGLSVVDPRHLAANKLPPPVHIEKITADGKEYDPARGPLPPQVRDLTIDYTALSLVVPEKVRFRFKLEGQDNDWREVVNDRKVQYSNLGPKHYRFLVKACNNSGVWNEEAATLDFVIPPAWYQTNWFRALCVAAFLALMWVLYQLRLRQMAGQFNMRLEERVGERTRIARDLHDTLLQSFQGLVFRFQAARYHLPDRPEEACEALDSALVSADQALAEGRNSIQELRSEPLKESNMEQMLLALGRELASSQNGEHGSPTLRVIVEGTRRAKPAMTRQEIYRIARELLRNAYRHAHARSIEAELRYEDDAFVLIVRDDGKGIDPQVLKEHGRAGHWGMRGIYERAEGIGARLDVWSQAGAGTEVRLTVPGAIAYEKSRDGGRFKLFRKTRTHEHRP